MTSWVTHALLWMTAFCQPTQGTFLPFGIPESDAILSMDFDSATFSVDSFVFYGDTYTTIIANMDGAITFTQTANFFQSRPPFPDITFPLICVYCGNFVPDSENRTWYRFSVEPSDLQPIQDLARQFPAFGPSFTPDWAVVVTWDSVGKAQTIQPGNTIQVVVAADGMTSLVLLDYEDIGWIDERPINEDDIDDVRTKVGFTKGNGESFYLQPFSNSEDLRNLTTTSNIDMPGLFLFRVDLDPILPEPTLPSNTTTTATTTTTTTTPTTTTSKTTTTSETTTTTPETTTTTTPETTTTTTPETTTTTPETTTTSETTTTTPETTTTPVTTTTTPEAPPQPCRPPRYKRLQQELFQQRQQERPNLQLFRRRPFFR